MKLKIVGAKLLNQIAGDRKRSTSSIATNHPDTIDWKLSLVEGGLLCEARDGKLKVIPLSNISEMFVERVETVTKSVIVKKVK